jgi:hypothetical protein
MSNYPPTPSFGLNFSFAPVPPSSGARPTMSGGSRHPTGSVQRKPPVPPPITNSSVNTYQQDANIPSFNITSTYRAPPTVPSFGQVTDGSIPPPFPTMRTPQEFSEQITPFPTGPGSDSSYAFPPQHRSAQVENVSGTANTDHLTVQLDKEEGELSDRDMERKSTSSQEVGIVVPQPTRSGTIDGSNHVTDAGGAWNQKGQKGKSLVTRGSIRSTLCDSSPHRLLS